MNECTPNWPAYFGLQVVLLATGLITWRTLRRHRLQTVLPVFCWYLAAFCVIELLSTLSADSCLYPENIRAAVCGLYNGVFWVSGYAMPIFLILVQREIMVHAAGASPDAQSRAAAWFWRCVIVAIAVIAFAAVLAGSTPASSAERAAQILYGSCRLITISLFVMIFVIKRRLATPMGLRWVIWSLLALYVADLVLSYAGRNGSGPWLVALGQISVILMLVGFLMGARSGLVSVDQKIPVQ